MNMEKSSGKFIPNLVVVMTIVAYFRLFGFKAIPYPIQVLSQPLMCSVMLTMIIIKVIYFRETVVKMHFSTPVLLLIFSTIPSLFIAYYYHNQTFLGSIWASNAILFYVLYFYLHYFKISPRFLLKVIVYIGVIVVGFYYVQYVMYPTKVFNAHMFEDRGTIRMFIPGMLCTQLAYFYFLNRFFKNTSYLNLLLALVCLSIFILQGTRQFIFAFALLTLINMAFYRKMRSKFLIMITVTAGLVLVFVLFKEIFAELTQVSSSQSSNLSEGIRIKAARFYLTSFMPDGLAYIFGNNQPALGGPYSQKMVMYTLKYGFYLSDIGLIGDYVTYGIVFVLAGLVLVFKGIFFKVRDQYKFLKYYIVFQSMTLIAGRGIFSGVDILILSIVYIFDQDRAHVLLEHFDKQEQVETENTSEKELLTI